MFQKKMSLKCSIVNEVLNKESSEEINKNFKISEASTPSLDKINVNDDTKRTRSQTLYVNQEDRK